MSKLERIRANPARTERLAAEEAFYSRSGLNPIYVDQGRGLVDVTTLCSFIHLHEGPRLDDEFSTMLSYLNSSHFRHSLDNDAGQYSEALAKLKSNPEGHSGSVKFPFFVYPITAYFFARWHLRKSPQLYNIPLEPNSNLFSPELRKMITGQLNELREASPLIHYMAMHDVSFSLKTCAKELEEGHEFTLDVIIQVGSDKYHEALPLPGGEVSGTFMDIISEPAIAKHLKGLKIEDQL